MSSDLDELFDLLAPLMDEDFCQPYTSAWELNRHSRATELDGEELHERIRAAYQRLRESTVDLNALMVAARDAHLPYCESWSSHWREFPTAEVLEVGWMQDPDGSVSWIVECPDGQKTRTYGPTLRAALIAFAEEYGPDGWRVRGLVDG